jgi:uncharacterized protein (DUF305 family)
MDDDSAEERAGARRTLIWAAVGGGFIVLLAVALLVWWSRPRPPGDDSPEAGFARDMSVHHTQAVEMSLIIRDRTEDTDLSALATDIMLTQQNQIGQMYAWLEQWDLPQTGREAAMSWMGHPTEGLMPGMATPAQVAALRELPLDEAEVEFLRLMIAHHQGGVHMAEAVLDLTDDDDVLRLANATIVAQQAEIEVMETMLRARGVTE